MKTETIEYIKDIANYMTADSIDKQSSREDICMSLYKAVYTVSEFHKPLTNDYSLEIKAIDLIEGVDSESFSEWHTNADSTPEFADEWEMWVKNNERNV